MINKAIKNKCIRIWHNPKGEYFNVEFIHNHRKVYTSVFFRYEKRMYRKLMKLFPTRWL